MTLVHTHTLTHTMVGLFPGSLGASSCAFSHCSGLRLCSGIIRLLLAFHRCAKAAASPGPGETRGRRGRGGRRRGRRGRREEAGPGRGQVPGPVGPQDTEPVRHRQQQPDVPHPGGVRGLHPHALLPLSAVSRKGAEPSREDRNSLLLLGGVGRIGGARLWSSDSPEPSSTPPLRNHGWILVRRSGSRSLL